MVERNERNSAGDDTGSVGGYSRLKGSCGRDDAGHNECAPVEWLYIRRFGPRTCSRDSGSAYNSLHQWNGKLMTSAAIGYRRVGTHIHAVEAHDAARKIDDMIGKIDALGRADVGTPTAVDTQIGIDVSVVERYAGYVAEDCSDRTNSIAQQATSAPRDYYDESKSGSRSKKPGKTYRQRTQRGSNDSGKRTIGIEQRDYGRHTEKSA